MTGTGLPPTCCGSASCPRAQSGTVRTDAAQADEVVSLQSDPVAAIRRLAPGGVDRIVEAALSANADLDAEVSRNGTVLAAAQSALSVPVAEVIPLGRIAAAHELVESGRARAGSWSRFRDA